MGENYCRFELNAIEVFKITKKWSEKTKIQIKYNLNK